MIPCGGKTKWQLAVMHTGIGQTMYMLRLSHTHVSSCFVIISYLANIVIEVKNNPVKTLNEAIKSRQGLRQTN